MSGCFELSCTKNFSAQSDPVWFCASDNKRLEHIHSLSGCCQQMWLDGREACAVTERVCAVTERACAVTERVCAVTERACAVTERACAVTERACAVTW